MQKLSVYRRVSHSLINVPKRLLQSILSLCALAVLTDFLLCLFLCSTSNTETKRDGSPLKQISKSNNCSPAHRAHQKQSESGGTQESDSTVPAAPQDAHKPASNGVVAQMEQDKEKEERNSESVRIETTELVNGDMGAEQRDDHSPPHTDRTGRESLTKNEDSGTESEHRNGEGSTDQKVRARLLC